MASLVLKMSISLDGYVAPPDGSGGWKLAGRSDDARDWVVETVSNARAHLVSAATYGEWARDLVHRLGERPGGVFSSGAVAHVFAAHP